MSESRKESDRDEMRGKTHATHGERNIQYSRGSDENIRHWTCTHYTVRSIIALDSSLNPLTPASALTVSQRHSLFCIICGQTLLFFDFLTRTPHFFHSLRSVLSLISFPGTKVSNMKRGSEEMLPETADQVSPSSLTAALSHLNSQANSMSGQQQQPIGRQIRARVSPLGPESRFWNQSPAPIQTEWRPMTGNRITLHTGSHPNGNNIICMTSLLLCLLTVTFLLPMSHRQECQCEMRLILSVNPFAVPVLSPHPQNGPGT